MAQNLEMGDAEIRDIENNCKGAEDQRMSFLRRWTAKEGKYATYKSLSKVLKSLGEQGAADQLREIARP